MKPIHALSIFLAFISTYSVASAASSPLKNVVESVTAAVASGITPIAVFDLDETLLYTHDRKLRSYRETLPALATRYPAEVQNASALILSDFFSLRNAYDANELFKRVGIRTEGFPKIALDQAFPVYLSAKYMDLDTAIPCAVEFVNSIRNAGAHIVFVSSRLATLQYSATIISLETLGFINRMNEWDDTETVLRSDGLSSIDFKTQAFKNINETQFIHGVPAKPLFAFENEPENIDAMEKAFPKAELYFIEGAFLKSGTIPTKAHLIKNFCN